MNEFKFVCPVCHQHIKVELWRSNSMMECPTCFQRIIVPQAPADDNVELIITGSKAHKRSVSKPEPGFGTPPPPAPPAKDSSMAGIVFVIVLCAVIAAAFVFGGKIFKSTGGKTGGQTGGQTNPGILVQKPEKPPPPPPPKPIGGLAFAILAKGDSIAVKSGTIADDVKDPAKAAFFTAFKADLANPLPFDGAADLSVFSGYDNSAIPNASGNIQWHNSFQGGLVIGVTLQGLVPGHDYVLTLNGDPQRAGNNSLPDRVANGNGQKCYDFTKITTDMTGSCHATFGVKLPAGKYDVAFYVKDPTDWKLPLANDTLQFTVQ